MPDKSEMLMVYIKCCFEFFAIFLAAAAGNISNELISKTPIHFIDSITTTATNTTKIFSISRCLIPLLAAKSAFNDTSSSLL